MALLNKCVKQYVESKSLNQRESSVWKYFLREINGQSAICKLCNKTLKANGGSTKGLHAHLNAIHKINVLKRRANMEGTSSNRQRNNAASSSTNNSDRESKTVITDCMKMKVDDTLPTILARMIALDGLSFNIFCTSFDLREALRAKGFNNLPNSPNAIRDLVMSYFMNVKDTLRNEIIRLKTKSVKFCLTFDECTALPNRRFTNIHLHYVDSARVCRSLGLQRVHDSMPAEKCVVLLQKKLQDYNISLETDIISITTDGASVLGKVETVIPAYQQLCFAHAIQLAVIDVLYECRFDNARTTVGQQEIQLEESDSSDEDVEFTEDFEHNPELANTNIKSLIQKIRKTVKFFRKSPTNTDCLSQNIKETYKKETSLILDTKTKWNSLVDMLERFITLKPCIIRTLSDSDSNISFTDYDFELASIIFSVLQPIKITVEALCRKDANLLTCEAALKFMMNKLEHIDTDLCHAMKHALHSRLTQTRTELSGVLQYLHNGPTVYEINDCLFSIPPVARIRKFATEYLENLDQQTARTDENIGTKEELADARIEASTSFAYKTELSMEESIVSTSLLKNELDDIIKYSVIPAPLRTAAKQYSSLSAVISREIITFEELGTRGENLQRLYDYLISVPPTSVESEKAFSATGITCSKVESSMNNCTLDALCFLRSYFKNA